MAHSNSFPNFLSNFSKALLSHPHHFHVKTPHFCSIDQLFLDQKGNIISTLKHHIFVQLRNFFGTKRKTCKFNHNGFKVETVTSGDDVVVVVVVVDEYDVDDFNISSA